MSNQGMGRLTATLVRNRYKGAPCRRDHFRPNSDGHDCPFALWPRRADLTARLHSAEPSAKVDV